jgi:hypothetical protein
MTQNSLLKNLLAFPSLLHLIASSSPQSFLKGKSEGEGGLITPLCSRLTTPNSRFFIHAEPAQHRPSN